MKTPLALSGRQRPFFGASTEAGLQSEQSRTVQFRTAHTALRTEHLVNRGVLAQGGAGVALVPRAPRIVPVSVPLLAIAGFGLVVVLGSLLFR